MTSLLRQPGVRSFLLVWVGQFVSLVGSGLTAFALGIWIFQSTASTTQYALVTFCATVPLLLILPFAGPLIDRYDRKRLLIACDVVGASTAATVGLLAWTGNLSLGAACAIVAVMSSATAIQWPTWSASVTLLVPHDQLGRASGMTQIAQASAQVLAPLFAGILVTLVGIAGVTSIDVVTFLVSIATLVAATIPPAPRRAEEGRSYWRDLPIGWRYVLERSGLASLLVMFAAVNFCVELASVLFTPLVLSFTTPAALGTIVAVGSVGMIGAGVLLSAWGGPKRPALGAALFAALGGAAVCAAGLTTSTVLLAAAAAAFFFFLSLVAGSSQVVWQRAVPPELQGRVFSVRAAMALSAVPLASLVAGPFADRVFEPAMAQGGALAEVFGSLVGVGKGRGIALMIVAAGMGCVAAAIAAAAYGPLRRLDTEAPPRVPKTVPAEAAG